MNAKIFFVACLALSGCASNQLKHLDTDIDAKGASAQGVIGVKDQTVIIQRETSAEDELRTQQWKNNKAEESLTHEWYLLKTCRVEAADPRLGGSGEVVPLQDIDGMKHQAEVKEEFGVNENGNLQFVSKEDFLKRISIERQYGDSLHAMNKSIRDARESCELRMSGARIKAGLSAYKNGSQSLDVELVGK